MELMFVRKLQLYCDPVWTDVPCCKEWIAKSIPERLSTPFPDDARELVEDFYFENYAKFFGTGKYAQGLRCIPSIMVIGRCSRTS